MSGKRFDWDVCEGDALFYEDGAVIDYDDVVELLNAFNKENEELKSKYSEQCIQLDFLKDENQHMRDLVNENEQLKTKNNAYIQDIEVFKEENTHLKLKNEQLQARNDRQAKQLDRLYQLISQKDWRTLTDIMDDFKRCEERLQREWRTYE